ncbi:hypothetical protein Tsubulata_045105, partial [Turnera subulata]
GGVKGKGKGKAKGKVPVSTKPRFCWQQEDVNGLIIALQEIVVSGLKVDAGSFKSGTYKLIKSKLSRRMSAERASTITGENTRNKIRALKDKYMAWDGKLIVMDAVVPVMPDGSVADKEIPHMNAFVMAQDHGVVTKILKANLNGEYNGTNILD